MFYWRGLYLPTAVGISVSLYCHCFAQSEEQSLYKILFFFLFDLHENDKKFLANRNNFY